jgi:hypothetical protein
VLHERHSGWGGFENWEGFGEDGKAVSGDSWKQYYSTMEQEGGIEERIPDITQARGGAESNGTPAQVTQEDADDDEEEEEMDFEEAEEERELHARIELVNRIDDDDDSDYEGGDYEGGESEEEDPDLASFLNPINLMVDKPYERNFNQNFRSLRR